MLCPIKVNSNTIELTVHTSCYCFLDLLCVKIVSIYKGISLVSPKFNKVFDRFDKYLSIKSTQR